MEFGYFHEMRKISMKYVYIHEMRIISIECGYFHEMWINPQIVDISTKCGYFHNNIHDQNLIAYSISQLNSAALLIEWNPTSSNIHPTLVSMQQVKHKNPQYQSAFHTLKKITQNSTIPERGPHAEKYNPKLHNTIARSTNGEI